MKTSIYRDAVTVAAFAGLLALAGCNDTTPTVSNTNTARNVNNSNVGTLVNSNANTARKEVNYNTPDGLVTAKIKLKLFADSKVSANEVDVDTTDNVVTLSGKLDTDAAKAAAEADAKSVSGVKSVNNALTVVPTSAQKAVEAKDDEIQKAVDNYLDNDPAVKDQHLKGKVNAGVVTLNGDVDNYKNLVDAAAGVRKIAGVKRVETSAVHNKGESTNNNNTGTMNKNLGKH